MAWFWIGYVLRSPVVGKLHQDLSASWMSEFFEAIWHGEGVGDGGDPQGAAGLCRCETQRIDQACAAGELIQWSSGCLLSAYLDNDGRGVPFLADDQ